VDFLSCFGNLKKTQKMVWTIVVWCYSDQRWGFTSELTDSLKGLSFIAFVRNVSKDAVSLIEERTFISSKVAVFLNYLLHSWFSFRFSQVSLYLFWLSVYSHPHTSCMRYFSIYLFLDWNCPRRKMYRRFYLFGVLPCSPVWSILGLRVTRFRRNTSTFHKRSLGWK
jgi:hypothetical protein